MVNTRVAATASSPTGSVEEALSLAARILSQQPELARAQARQVLAAVPGHPVAMLVEAKALRWMGQPDAALPILERLIREQPRAPAVFYEMARVCDDLGQSEKAIAGYRRATSLKQDWPEAWTGLAAALRSTGRNAEADRADLAAVQAATRDPELVRVAVLMGKNAFDEAGALLRTRLKRKPQDAVALRMQGELLWRIGDLDKAVPPLEQAVALAPGFTAARDLLIRILGQANRLGEAVREATALMERDPDPAHVMLKASMLVRIGEQNEARSLYEKLLERWPENPRIWMNLGHVLKTIGERDKAIGAYRRASALAPTMGEAWWSLANLKTLVLDEADIAAMNAALATLDGREEAAGDALHLHFALGKALEDASENAAAIAHYSAGNRLRAALHPHDDEESHLHARDHAATFNAPFISKLEDDGCLLDDPIFIVGLPRAGSTLVEQILSSHSMVEGTMELPDLMMIAARLESQIDEGRYTDYADLMESLTPQDRKRLGEEYLDRTRPHRRSDKPRFIDKMPNNWQHVGLIRAILPNAKVIDARRHPLGCCFSGWKQHFARGQDFTYDLTGIGRYYRDYVAQMAAFDEAAPGAVHRVIYEEMVADTRGQVERLLDYLGLPFEETCLSFWKNNRAVRTASSEQVRRPIFTDAVEHWKRFEPWLSDLVTALGPVTHAYPAPPADWRAWLEGPLA